MAYFSRRNAFSQSDQPEWGLVMVTSSQHQTYEYDVTAGSSIRLKFCDSLCRILEKSLLFPLSPSPIIESFIQIANPGKTGAASSTSKQDRHSTPQSFFLRQLFGVWGGKRGRGLRLTIRIGVSFYVAAGGPVLNILHYSAARTRSKYELQLSARI